MPCPLRGIPCGIVLASGGSELARRSSRCLLRWGQQHHAVSPRRCRSLAPQHRCRSLCVSAKKAADVSTQQPSAEAQQLIPTSSSGFCSRDPTQPPCWIPPLIFFGLATLFSAVILKNRQRKAAVKEQDELVIAPSPEQDPRAYQRALARSRQAAYVTKALAFNKAGEPARAFMELSRALAENSICRSPMLDGHHTKPELVELYKLHIKYSEVPPNFATLLQLQEMLGLEQEEAEKIELEVLQAPGAFNI